MTEDYKGEIKRTEDGHPYGVITKNGEFVWRDKPWRIHDGSAQAELSAKLRSLREAEQTAIVTKGETMDQIQDFGWALNCLKVGMKVCRAGWNGKGMWLAYMPPVVIPEGMVNGRTKKFVPTGDLRVGGYIVMWTADGTWQPGWLASQADMLAEDWEIAE